MINFFPITELSQSEYNKSLIEYKSRLCEYCYGNLYAWKDYYQTSFTIFDKTIYIFQYIIDGEKYFSYPIGSQTEEQVKKIITELFSFCKKQNKTFRMINLTKTEIEILEKLFPLHFEFEEKRENFDYLYETEPLRTFKGKKLHSKRNHLNRFYTSFADNYSFEQITSENISECIEFNEKWCKINQKSADDDLRAEEKIALEFLENFKNLPLIGGILKAGGEVCAYTIGEAAYPFSDTLIIHIEKALYDIPGAYPAIFSMFLNTYKDFLYVNREDDLGHEGLRKSKLSYNPIMLLEKYQCVLKKGY